MFLLKILLKKKNYILVLINNKMFLINNKMFLLKILLKKKNYILVFINKIKEMFKIMFY